MRRPLSLVFSLALPLFATACGGDAAAADDPASAGMKATANGDYDAAVGHFDDALAGMEASSPDYKEIALSRAEALAHTAPEKVEGALKALQGLVPADFGRVANALIQAKDFELAGKTVKLGTEMLPGNADMKEIEKSVVAMIEKVGGEAGAAALKGLGYLGGD